MISSQLCDKGIQKEKLLVEVVRVDQYWIIPSGVILSSCELTLDFLHSAGMSIFGLSIHVFFCQWNVGQYCFFNLHLYNCILICNKWINVHVT